MRNVFLLVTAGSQTNHTLEIGDEIQTLKHLLNFLKGKGINIDLKGNDIVITPSLVTLQLEDALLPTTDFGMLVAATKIKGANADVSELQEYFEDDDGNTSRSDIQELEYDSLMYRLKSIRTWAKDNNHEEILELTKKYNSINVPTMRERLEAIFDVVFPPVVEESDSETTTSEFAGDYAEEFQRMAEELQALRTSVDERLQQIQSDLGRVAQRVGVIPTADASAVFDGLRDLQKRIKK